MIRKSELAPTYSPLPISGRCRAACEHNRSNGCTESVGRIDSVPLISQTSRGFLCIRPMAYYGAHMSCGRATFSSLWRVVCVPRRRWPRWNHPAATLKRTNQRLLHAFVLCFFPTCAYRVGFLSCAHSSATAGGGGLARRRGLGYRFADGGPTSQQAGMVIVSQSFGPQKNTQSPRR